MKSEQQIKQLETELRELLQRVMQAPLSPITGILQSVQDHLGDVEDLVKNIRDVDLAVLPNAEDVKKQIRLLKSTVESTSEEVQKTVRPLLQQEIKQLEQAQHANIQQLQTELKTNTEEKVHHLRETFGAQMQQQFEQSELSFAQLFAHITRIEQRSDAVLEKTSQDLTEKIAAVATSVTELQAALAAQSEQIGLIHRQQVESPLQLAKQVGQVLRPVRQWLIAAVCVASAGLIGIAVLAAHQFY